MAKPKKNNFDDVKMLIATLSIATTLVFWHLFSASAASAEEQVSVGNIPQEGITIDPESVKILFGGVSPEHRMVVYRLKSSGLNRRVGYDTNNNANTGNAGKNNNGGGGNNNANNNTGGGNNNVSNNNGGGGNNNGGGAVVTQTQSS